MIMMIANSGIGLMLNMTKKKIGSVKMLKEFLKKRQEKRCAKGRHVKTELISTYYNIVIGKQCTVYRCECGRHWTHFKKYWL